MHYISATAGGAESQGVVDPRIRVKSRALKGKKAFQFHEPGSIVARSDALAEKEQKKVLQ
jgi:hypothetical protein